MVTKAQERVLFDCHPPKGPHIHIDDDQEGISLEWKRLDDTRVKFFAEVLKLKKFGEFLSEV